MELQLESSQQDDAGQLANLSRLTNAPERDKGKCQLTCCECCAARMPIRRLQNQGPNRVFWMTCRPSIALGILFARQLFIAEASGQVGQVRMAFPLTTARPAHIILMGAGTGRLLHR
jgi:hypothetical protein